MKKITLDISGMHCASCSTVINRGLDKKQGVISANVNLSTNKATVEYDETKLTVKDLIEVVRSKGYDAALALKNPNYDAEAKKRAIYLRNLKYDFYFGLIFTIPVFILGMFFMKNPIPYQSIFMWLLASPVQFIVAWPMYKSAWAALKGKSANMDTLIVMGTSAAYFYSVYAILSGKGHVYFEASAVLITIVVFGRLLATPSYVI